MWTPSGPTHCAPQAQQDCSQPRIAPPGKPEDLTLDKHHCQVNGHVHLDVVRAPDAPAGAASNAPVRQQLPCGAHLVGRNLSNALPVCSELATAAFCHLALTAYCRRVALRMWRSCEVLGRLHVGLA